MCRSSTRKGILYRARYDAKRRRKPPRSGHIRRLGTVRPCAIDRPFSDFDTPEVGLGRGATGPASRIRAG